MVPWKRSLIQKIGQFFAISLNASFGVKGATDGYTFTVTYLYESRFSAIAMIKTKYQPRINLETEMILPIFDEVCTNKQAHTSHLCRIFLFVVSSLNNTLWKSLLLARRKSSKLFQRRRNEKRLRTTAVSGSLKQMNKTRWICMGVAGSRKSCRILVIVAEKAMFQEKTNATFRGFFNLQVDLYMSNTGTHIETCVCE